MSFGPQMADISVNIRKGVIFNTGPYGDTLKIKKSKIGLRHVLSWPKLSLEPKFHDSGTFFTFFALDRLGAPKKKFFLQKSYFYPKRVQKKLTKNIFL